jgi:hypothetical protein
MSVPKSSLEGTVPFAAVRKARFEGIFKHRILDDSAASPVTAKIRAAKKAA